jgi:steroid delta-isomerase-like uncharacterized protein
MMHRNKPRILVGLVVVALLAMGVSFAVAQDTSTNVYGDQNSQAWQNVQQFFQSGDFGVLGSDFQWNGPLGQQPLMANQMANADTLFNRNAFADSSYDIRSAIVTDNAVAVEFTFHGTQNGAFMGQTATSRPVNLPAVAVFHFDDNDQVDTVHTYYDTDALRSQLGFANPGYTYSAPAALPVTGDQASLDDIIDNPMAYDGMQVSVLAVIREFVGGVPGNGLIVHDYDLLNPDPALVVGANADILNNAAFQIDQAVEVDGTVYGAGIINARDQLGYDLNWNTGVDFQNIPVIVADQVTIKQDQNP